MMNTEPGHVAQTVGHTTTELVHICDTPTHVVDFSFPFNELYGGSYGFAHYIGSEGQLILQDANNVDYEPVLLLLSNPIECGRAIGQYGSSFHEYLHHTQLGLTYGSGSPNLTPAMSWTFNIMINPEFTCYNDLYCDAILTWRYSTTMAHVLMDATDMQGVSPGWRFGHRLSRKAYYGVSHVGEAITRSYNPYNGLPCQCEFGFQLMETNITTYIVPTFKHNTARSTTRNVWMKTPLPRVTSYVAVLGHYNVTDKKDSIEVRAAEGGGNAG